MENAPARIRWLEDVIRTQLPHFNLYSAPDLIVGQPDIASSSGGDEYGKRLHMLEEHTTNSPISDLLY
jgi:hypothetical protein